MLTEYIQVALKRAIYEMLENGSFYAEIPGLQGLYANAKTLEACREELKESLEEWIVLGLQLGHTLPVLDGISLFFSKEKTLYCTKSPRSPVFLQLFPETSSRQL